MKFWIYQEADADTGRIYFASYSSEDRTGYLCLSTKSVEECEERTNRKLNPKVILAKVVGDEPQQV